MKRKERLYSAVFAGLQKMAARRHGDNSAGNTSAGLADSVDTCIVVEHVEALTQCPGARGRKQTATDNDHK